jgi:hypothetical protein
LRTAERGCLVLADFSGYTEYLIGSELEHAHGVVSDLIEVVVRNVRPVLQVSKLEGDGVFAYVIAGSYGPSTLLDTIEQTYFAFRTRIRDVVHATSCICRACERIPMLDLKFFVHDGTFVRSKVGRGEELVGGDVVVVHRLAKNSAAEALGARGYVLFTDACVRALGLDPEALELQSHVERYEDIGEVQCWLDNLDRRWRFEQERNRVYVPAKSASFEHVLQTTAEPAIAWEWLTSPARRVLWQADGIDAVTPGGRLRPGASNHCVHGGDVVVEEIADWRPFRYFTMRYQFPEVGAMLWTTELEPDDGGTVIRWRGERVSGRRAAGWQKVAPMLLEHVDAMSKRLGDRLADAATAEAHAVPAAGA